MKVVIVGAGVAGLGIGWRLAQAGVAVTVLERAQVGNGATTASAGMIAATAELGASDRPEALLARRVQTLWPAFAEELQQQSGIDIGYRRNGALVAHMQGETPASGFLDGPAARAREPLLGSQVAAATWLPDEAEVDSQALCRALAVSLVRAGGKVLSNETAVRFEWSAGRISGIATPFATHHADAYILAMGAWASRIEGLPKEVVPPVIPVKGEIVVLTPPAGGNLPAEVVWGNGIYAVPRRDRLLVGATMEQAGFDTQLTHAALSWLYRQAVGLMPALSEWRLTQHWAGLRPATPDLLPVLGPTSVDDLYVAGGQFRSGILFAPAIAEVLSRLVLERAAVDPHFDPRRFAKDKTGAPVAETPHRDIGDEAGEWRTGS